MEKTNMYANGQIYAIRSHQTEMIYIGSTCQPLHKRFHQHKINKKNCSSKQIICYKDAYIELIENFQCNSKKELNRKEGQYIRNYDCVNKLIAGRTTTEYYQDNKDKLAEQMKEYYTINKDEINTKKKEYYEANKEKILENMKEWRDANKDEINKKRRERRSAAKEMLKYKK